MDFRAGDCSRTRAWTKVELPPPKILSIPIVLGRAAAVDGLGAASALSLGRGPLRETLRL
jgi:hypothetical protein